MPSAGINRFLICFRKIPEFLAAGCEKIPFCSIALMLCHQAEVFPEEDHKEDHIQGQQGIKIVRNRGKKKLKSIHSPALRYIRIHRGSPAGNWSNDADRCRRRVDDVSQLCSGNPVFVGDRAHDRPDGETIEIIVDEDKDTKSRRCGESGFFRLQVPGRPAPVRRCAAAFTHQHDDHAEQHIEDNNVEIHAVRHRGEQRCERLPGMRAGDHEGADCDAAEKRQINFLCHQRQNDGNDGRKQ